MKYIASLSLTDETDELITEFLEGKANTGSKTKIVYKSAIYRFFQAIKRDSFRKVTGEDTQYYLKETLNHDQFMRSYKLNQMACLYGFFDWITEQLRLNPQLRNEGKDFYNPIPKGKYLKLPPDPQPTIKEERKNDSDKFYTVDQMIQILQKMFKIDYEKYIQVLLLTFCGMRVSEVVSIKKENISIEERFLVTGFEENCRKSNKGGDKGLYFFFPEAVANQLYDYLLYHDQKYGNNPWLFPSPRLHNTGYNSVGKLSMVLASLGKTKVDPLPFCVRTHKFRHSLAHYRGLNDFPVDICELLSNHKVTSIEARIYRNVTLEQRRDYYDRYFPKEYQKILAVIREL